MTPHPSLLTRHCLTSGGFTYIGALILVVVVGIGLGTAGRFWSTVMKREREQELMFAGDQIRRAIDSYYRSTPGGRLFEYPRNLQDLLKDPRQPSAKRHLRRLYRNPLSKDGRWEFVYDSKGSIKGVFANSGEAPLKRSRFPRGYEGFEKASAYREWKFTQDGVTPHPTPAPAPQGARPSPKGSPPVPGAAPAGARP